MNMITKVLKDDASGIHKSVEILQNGGLVALPTETVYGLGADAFNDQAVARIFEAKGRPRFNPLIVHVHSIAAAQNLVEWSDNAERLASAFWPGPLTLVLPLRMGTGISNLVSAELTSLAIRMPAHPVAQSLLKSFGGPVAAPSANPSGEISPTTVAHVLAGLGTRIDAVIDGGPCGVGLESTIIGLTEEARLLRPGGLPNRAVEDALGRPLSKMADGSPLNAPGQMASHYAPKCSVRLNAKNAMPGEVLLGFADIEGDLSLSRAGDLVEAAANLFDHLHALDAKRTPIAVAPIPETGLGIAINDRLRRAAAPR